MEYITYIQYSTSQNKWSNLIYENELSLNRANKIVFSQYFYKKAGQQFLERGLFLVIPNIFVQQSF